MTDPQDPNQTPPDDDQSDDDQSDEDYRNNPNEQHAEGIASEHADWDLWGNE